MALVFNNTNVTAITYNGTELTKIIYNGTEVWTGETPFIRNNSFAPGTSLQLVEDQSSDDGGCRGSFSLSGNTLYAHAEGWFNPDEGSDNESSNGAGLVKLVPNIACNGKTLYIEYTSVTGGNPRMNIYLEIAGSRRYLADVNTPLDSNKRGKVSTVLPASGTATLYAYIYTSGNGYSDEHSYTNGSLTIHDIYIK